MFYKNIAPIRIRETSKGWTVEIQKRKESLFRREKWLPLITYAGDFDKAFYFSKEENALACLVMELKCHTRTIPLK